MTLYIEVSTLASALNFSDGIPEAEAPLLDMAAAAASESIEEFCNRIFALDDVASARTFEFFNLARLDVDDIGVASGITATADGAPFTAFTTRPLNAIARGKPITSLWANPGSYFQPSPVWPQAAQFTVTARWGWPAVPAQVQQAALILAIRLYKRKGSSEGIAGFADLGPVRIANSDPDVARLLAPYRKLVLA